MRKILALILTLTMVLGLAVTAFAADATETGNATKTVTLTVVYEPAEEPVFDAPGKVAFPLTYEGTPVKNGTTVEITGAGSASVTLNLEVEYTYDDEAEDVDSAKAEALEAAVNTELAKYSFEATVVPNWEAGTPVAGTGDDLGKVTITYTEKDPAEAEDPTKPGDGVTTPHDGSQAHTITIKNLDQNVDHTYKAYQVFKGDLNDVEKILSNIVWGDGVDGDAIIEILNAAIADGEKPEYLDDSEWDAFVTKAQAYAEAQKPTDWDDEEDGEWTWTFTTAAEVADFISGFTSTNGDDEREVDEPTEDAGLIDTFAAIVADNVTEGAGVPSEQDANDPTVYTIPVTGDGYYLVIDETTALDNTETLASDTVSKYLLQVIRDREINAKDTGLNPDKKILNDENKRVAADSANIGDTVTYSVVIDVPDTRKYVDHFVFVMNDTLQDGLTYSDNYKVKIGDKDFTNFDMTIDEKAYIDDGTVLTGEDLKFTDYDPAHDAEDVEYFVNQAGGQEIRVNFNDFKNFVESNDLVGNSTKITITYTAVVNKDATFGPTANENEVKFEYSKNPNWDYNGDDFEGEDPKGITPDSTTKTYVTTMKLNKVDGETGKALEGAEFAINYDDINFYKLTGERFIEDYDKDAHTPEDIWVSTTTTPEEGDPVTTWKLKDGLTVDETTTYWALNDGSYTDTDPTSENMNDTQYKKDDDGNYVTAVKATYVEYVEGDANEKTVTVITDGSGTIHIEGVHQGKYSIKETKAPDGYNTLKETLDVEIGWIDPEWATTTDETEAAAWEALTPEQQAQAKTSGGFYIINHSENATFTWNGEEDTMAWEITIENNKGTELPSTGGIGTTIFYIVGGLLAVGAGVVLVAKKRMGKVED